MCSYFNQNISHRFPNISGQELKDGLMDAEESVPRYGRGMASITAAIVDTEHSPGSLLSYSTWSNYGWQIYIFGLAKRPKAIKIC